MFKALVAAGVVASSLAVVPQTAQAADADPTHTLAVSGPGDVGMYPAYDPSISRYAATTTDETFPGNDVDNTQNTGGTVTVSASTSDPDGYVLVDGMPLTGTEQTLTGVHAGQEIAVTYVDSGGREADSVIVLPAGFPTLTRTVGDEATTPDYYVGLTLSQFQTNGWPVFNTVVDGNGVPVWVESTSADATAIDLKRQPNGSYSYAVAPPASGQTGYQIVEFDDQFHRIAAHHTALPLTDTDNHDSILRADGSEVLLGYEPNSDTGDTDSAIQELDPDGNVIFQWDSRDLAGETAQPGAVDYAHINSVEVVDGGDDFLASFRNLSTVLKIARIAHDGYQPGDIVWKLGGRDSSFDFVDDPLDGNCAQHTATQLDSWQGVPGEYVMVFDDGSSSGLGASQCIDQTQPDGEASERHQSRAVIYRIDREAGTATLVWDYAPDGWFTWFMGSTQYLPDNDSILVGWASETRALATEVDADETATWQLSAEQSSNGRTYFSYRATAFDVPDATPPEVTLTSPAGGAVFDQDEDVTTSYTCSDTGGSTLQTCGDEPPGGALDTSTPGRHAYTVTATDGDGNTTSVTRHYTVLAAPSYRPDAMVQASTGGWVGARTYGGAGKQTVVQRIRRGHRQRVQVAVVNRGDLAGRCVVTGAGGSAAFAVTYRFGGADVTRAVERGTWRTPRTVPGARQVLQVLVKPTAKARVGSERTFTVRCRSTATPTRRDGVAVRAVVRR